MDTSVSLDDKYMAGTGWALMSGVQALVRLMLEQRRLDESRGLNTRIFVSGYPGSPLGGLDLELARARKVLDGIVFQPGLNEELAATAVAGTQLLDKTPGRRHDGVTGFWYGKNPGLDRAADAIRHGVVSGTAALGGAVALIGDDPASKSSTLPSSCEPMCQSLSMPLLAPGSVAEVIELGLHAVAMSRATGLWTGLKIVADVADASATIDVGALRHGIPMPATESRALNPILVGPVSVDVEHDMLTRRLNLARAYARSAGLNKITFSARQAKLGIIAGGTAYAVVQRALSDLGLHEPELDALGLRLIKLAMPFPLDREAVTELLSGLDEVLVVEDKNPFLETLVRDALYRHPQAPNVIGKFDETGKPLLSARGQVGAEDVARALARRVGTDRLPSPPIEIRPARLALPTIDKRTPYFCSGCPHNTSTRTGDDTLVGVGIGCHAMVALDGDGRGTQLGVTQMGGEGAQWIGLAPFTDDRHFVQNLGDGTFHHSGSLAIRAAIAAGVSMTYKLLYNDAVAMTGGQKAEGRVDVPALTRLLATEGVRRIVVTTDEPRKYRGVTLDPIASVRHRDEFADVERELSAMDGVTILIHDDRCAAEERRLRKRGTLPTPKEKVVINERVCEGCGDCGDVSTCLSVQPVETEFGRKTKIHQASCNSDFSCLKGDCPSFLLVEPGTKAKREVPALPVELPEPVLRVPADGTLLRMPGIGGTGVVTVSAILQMAARIDGRYAAGIEQTGLAQKGGPVVSDVRIAKQPITGSLRASRGGVDVLIGFDLLGCADDSNLAVCRPGHTIGVINTAIVPTAAMVTNRVVVPGSPDDSIERLESATRATGNLYLNAQGLSEALFDDHMPTNLLLVGAAYQHGCLPITAEAIEQAIRLNGASVEKSLAAFRWGRAAVVDPGAVQAAVTRPVPATVTVTPEARALAQDTEGDLHEVLSTRVADLIEFQDAAYARRYFDAVQEVAQRVGKAGVEVAIEYAKGLHRFMAYKDEYEVARLHLDTVERARRDAEFGPDASVSVLLHPPVFKAMGLKRKIRLRRTATPVFKALRAARRMRGTKADIFGYAKVRRLERELIEEYQQLVGQAVAKLTEDNLHDVVALVSLYDVVRGYEDVKLANVDKFRAQAREALAAL
ncbi:indolepyruvate ferredoxin oxidoreductase family protein [Actinocrispum sp. NPDC049592]|uniref:indolepyruvate ferredoxin oxidoreductase family protein n=1 Tax=Actinocrispum sp. NPDC049592 TaxID=3154835 RepID=UPI00344548B6